MSQPNHLPAAAPPRLALERASVLGPPGSGRLVRAASLALPERRTLALLGGPEDGTSLLLDLIAGHARIGGGAVRCDGAEIAAMPPHRRGIGIVSGRDPLFAHLDVAGNVGFSLRARGIAASERRRRVGDALALLGLEPVAAARSSSLGAADRARAMIARAIAAAPRLLLLDDPFRLLSPSDRAQLQRTLRRLAAARGLTVLMATGDRDEALLLGDEIGVLRAGTLHQVGPGTELLERPLDAVVADRIGDANLLPGRIVALHDDAALVRLPTGHVMEAEPFGVAEGAPCLLCVRPDRIATAFLSRAAPDGGAGAESLPAILQDAVHLGDHLRLRFRLADGTELLVRRPPAASSSELRPGRAALLAWQAHQARAFPLPD